jgi:hypothetical protein
VNGSIGASQLNVSIEDGRAKGAKKGSECSGNQTELRRSRTHARVSTQTPHENNTRYGKIVSRDEEARA